MQGIDPLSEQCIAKLLSCVRLLATPWTAGYQAPPSMGLSRQEYWSGLPLPSPRTMHKPLLKRATVQPYCDKHTNTHTHTHTHSFTNMLKNMVHQKHSMGASLVINWLRIHLPTQGTSVRSLDGKSPHALELLSQCTTVTEARAP